MNNAINSAALSYSNTDTYKVNIDAGNCVRKGITLFVACANARDCGNGDISRDGRLVAFYCEWRKCIAPGFAANELERAFLVDAFGAVPAL
jgi:hypothetical protein